MKLNSKVVPIGYSYRLLKNMICVQIHWNINFSKSVEFYDKTNFLNPLFQKKK